MATRYSQLETALILLENGADISLQDEVFLLLFYANSFVFLICSIIALCYDLFFSLFVLVYMVF